MAAGGEREGHAWIFAAGTSGWVEFCALRPSGGGGGGVAWFGSLEHVTQGQRPPDTLKIAT